MTTPAHHQLDVATFAEQARLLTRRMKGSDASAWLPLYERGLVAANEQGDIHGLSEIAFFAAVRLDTDGRHAEALAQLDLALSLAGSEIGGRALLSSLKAGYAALAGDAEAARRAVTEVDRIVARARPLRVRMESTVNAAIARRILLEPDSPQDVQRLTQRVQRTGFHWQLSGLLSWTIPWLVARGDLVAASPLVRMLSALATSTGHSWRTVDASVFRYGLERAESGTAEAPDTGDNYMAGWRAALLQLHLAQFAGGDPESAILTLRSIAPRIHTGFLDGAQVIDALSQREQRIDTEIGLPTPRGVSLINLGLVLAGAELVAARGTATSAALWLGWIGRSLPSEIRTSLEWPAARDRVEGLLRVRSGDLRGGVAQIRAAIRWCQEAGYATEGGIAQLQLAEILALSDLPATERRWRHLRVSAVETLRARGVDVVAAAYAATRVVALGRGARSTQLGAREVEVLGLLAEGMTYKEAAYVMGIQWRTVQSHAYRAYAKLGVSRRVAAVDVARRLGVI